MSEGLFGVTMTYDERSAYIRNYQSPELTEEEQIRLRLPLMAGELGNDYAGEAHIRASRYVNDVRWALGEIDRLRKAAKETVETRNEKRNAFE